MTKLYRRRKARARALRRLEGMHERPISVDPEGHKTAVVPPIEDFRAFMKCSVSAPSGLLEQRIETTFQIVSIHIG